MKQEIIKEPWEFDVSEINLGDLPEFKGITGMDRDKVLINAEDQSRLAVVSKEYDVITHKQALDTTLEAILETAKDDNRFRNYEIKANESLLRRNKALLRLDIEFPDINFDFGKTARNIDDIVNFQFSLLNGIDGGHPFSIAFGGKRLICTNGLTTKTTIDSIRFNHRRVEIPSLKEAIMNQFVGFNRLIDQWKILSKKKLTDDKIKELFERIKESAKENNVGVIHINRIEEKASEILEREGHSLWTFYNLATNYVFDQVKL